MNPPLSLLLFVTLMCSGLMPSSAKADDSAVIRQQITQLQKEVNTLRAENDALKRENEALKRSQSGGAVAAPSVAAPQPHVQPPKPTGASYWITIASGKRHNSGCRYYMNSKGRACGPDEGIPCKLCGG